MTVTIRAARIGDAPELLTLWREADVEPSHTDDVGSVTQLVVHDPEALIVAQEDGRIVGSVIAGWDGWRGSIYRLVVQPNHRRRGLGTRLLVVAEQRLVNVGASRLQAIVVENDSQATKFWQATNWEQQVERLRFVKG